LQLNCSVSRTSDSMHEIAAVVLSQRDADRFQAFWPAVGPVRRGHGVCVFSMRRCFQEVCPDSGRAVPDLEASDVAPALQEFLAPLLGPLRSSGISDVFCMIFSKYWGGAGRQAAVVVTHRGLISSLLVGEDAINNALGQVGVGSNEREDAFEKLGLDSWRQDAF